MSLFDNKLDETIKDKLYVDIYRDNFSGEALFSRIINRSEDILQIAIFNNDGEFDGFSFIYINDITRLRWKGNERESIERLILRNSEQIGTVEVNLSSVRIILEDLAKQFDVITVFTERIDSDICFIGQIEEIDDDHVLLREYGPLKSLDRGNILLGLDDITRVDVNGKYERNLLHLYSK